MALTGIGTGEGFSRSIEGHTAVQGAALLVAVDRISKRTDLAAFTA